MGIKPGTRLPSGIPRPRDSITGTRPILPCSVDGCEKRARARGLCWAHYKRWQRHGDPGVA